MNSKNVKLNFILSVIIVFLVIYFTYLNYVIEKNNIKEGNIGRRIRNTVKNAVKPVEKELLSKINKLEKKMENKVNSSVKPIKKSITNVSSKLSSISDIVNNIIKGIKNGVVTPLITVFKHIGLMFSQLGLLIFDFLLQIAQIPICLISYITWIFVTLKDQVITTIVLPIIQKIFKKIFGRFYPETIVSYFIKFLNWLINFHFYILSLFGSLLGINEIFYKEKCFNFTGNFKKRIDKMKKHLIDAGNSFTQFGKFKF
jgi:hypothetical protein